MDPTTPNAEALQTNIQIGPFTCAPFTFKTLILLEEISSPYVVPRRDEDGKVIKDYQPTLKEVAQTLWVFLNAHRPDAMLAVADRARFDTAVGHMASQITPDNFGEIVGGISKVFLGINKTMQESGMDAGDSEKKGPIGSSV